jgi:hypothetical protein
MRLVVGLTAVVGLAGAALFVATGRDVKESRPRADALSAGALIDSIGVNVHFSYVDTAYARQADVLARLRELGVRHIRDATPNPVEALRGGLRASRRAGVRATLLVDPAVDPAAAVADSLAVVGPGIAAFEGPNELNNSGDRGWPERLETYMRALATAVRKQAPRVPLVGPSFIDAASRSHIPADLPGLFNGHPYPGGQPPEGAVEQALGERRATARERDVVFTETGYHNALAATTGQPAASEEAAAVYLPRLLVTAFGAGVRRTFIYELVDEKLDPGLVDPEQHFGLLRHDLSPKPGFTAVKTLIDALRTSPGQGSFEPPSPTVRSRGDTRVEQLTLRRRDGSSVIALWRPVSVWDLRARRPVGPAPLPVELLFRRRARNVAVWRPSLATQPVLRLRHTRRLRLELQGDLVLVSLR